MTDPRVLLVHCGLPEVAPGPVERFLAANRGRLREGLDLVLPADLPEPARCARHFARHGQALALGDLAEALEGALPRRLSGDGRDAVISCDALAGMPPGVAPGPGATGRGRDWVRDWSAAAPLAAVVAGWLAERFPASAVRMVWVTRGDWRRRTWAHAVATGRTAEGEAAFAARLGADDPAGAVAAAAEAAAEAGGARVEPFVLQLAEAARHPQGPGGALLELIDLPEPARAALDPVSRDRVPPPPVLERLLAATRAGGPPAAQREARAAVLREAGLPAWAHAAATARG